MCQPQHTFGPTHTVNLTQSTLTQAGSAPSSVRQPLTMSGQQQLSMSRCCQSPLLSSSSSSRFCSAALALLQLWRALLLLLLLPVTLEAAWSSSPAASASLAAASVVASKSLSASLLRLFCWSCTCTRTQQAYVLPGAQAAQPHHNKVFWPP